MDQSLYSYNLLIGSSSTGSSFSIDKSGRYCFSVAGTFGGSTVGLQMLGPDGSTWISIEDDNGNLEITSAKAVLVHLPSGTFRASVSGGSGVSVYAILKRVID